MLLNQVGSDKAYLEIADSSSVLCTIQEAKKQKQTEHI